MSNTILIGVLRNLSDLRYEFETEDGEIYEIPPHIAEGVQYNYRIWLDMYSGDWGRLTEKVETKTLKSVLLLRTCAPGTSDTTFKRLKVEVERIGREVELFWKFYLGDLHNVRVIADVVEEEQAPWNTDWNKPMFQAWMKERAIPYGYFNYFHCWSHYGHDSWCGLGQVYGPYSWTQASCGMHTIIHELGHNFGLHHATRDKEEYGDKTCVMGSGGTNIPGLNAPHMAKLRVKARKPFASVSKSQWVVLAPMETPDMALFPQESVLAEVENSGKRVYLSIRRQRGAQYDYTVPNEDKVCIHTKTSDGKTQFHGWFSEGATQRLPNGVNVIYAVWSGDAAFLWVSYNGEEPTEPCPEWDETFPMDATPLEPYHNGLWLNPKVRGQGLSIIDGKATWFGHDSTEVSMAIRRPTWLYLDGYNSNFKELDRNNAILLFNTLEYGRDVVELERLTTPAAKAGMVEDDIWMVQYHIGIQNPGGVTDVFLFGHSDFSWYYGQDGVIYRSNGRWMQESDLDVEAVGAYELNGDTLTWSVNGSSYSIRIK